MVIHVSLEHHQFSENGLSHLGHFLGTVLRLATKQRPALWLQPGYLVLQIPPSCRQIPASADM